MSGTRTQHTPISHKSGSEHGFFDRRKGFKILILAGLAIASLLWTIKVMSKGPDAPTATGRRETMFPEKHNSEATHVIRPIEVSPTANAATATFALG
jgi:hypothetical protein